MPPRLPWASCSSGESENFVTAKASLLKLAGLALSGHSLLALGAHASSRSVLTTLADSRRTCRPKGGRSEPGCASSAPLGLAASRCQLQQCFELTEQRIATVFLADDRGPIA